MIAGITQLLQNRFDLLDHFHDISSTFSIKLLLIDSIFEIKKKLRKKFSWNVRWSDEKKEKRIETFIVWILWLSRVRGGGDERSLSSSFTKREAIRGKSIEGCKKKKKTRSTPMGLARILRALLTLVFTSPAFIDVFLPVRTARISSFPRALLPYLQTRTRFFLSFFLSKGTK